MNIFDFIKNLFKQPAKKENDWRNGLYPSPPDFRDVNLGAIQELIEPPKEYSIPYKLRVHNQFEKPICVGESGSLAKEEKERRENNFMEFDGDWLYNECKKIDGIPLMPGTYLRAMLKVLINKGIKPLNGSEADAKLFKIGGFASVDCNVFSLKSGIYKNGVILSGFMGSLPGWQNAHIRPPQEGEALFGHAIGNIAFNEQDIIGQNSWGEGWGDNGKLYYHENYLPFESWAILVDRPNIPELTKPLYLFRRNLGLGMQGEDVIELQNCLKYLGCFELSQTSTGIFGDKTLVGVKIFQQRFGILQTGYVGPLTRNKLNELFSEQSTTEPQTINQLIEGAAINEGIALDSEMYKNGLATLKCESGLNPNAKYVNNDGSIDRGIAQFNNKHWPDISDETAYSAEKVLPLFWKHFKTHPEWWVCYSTGKFNQFKGRH